FQCGRNAANALASFTSSTTTAVPARRPSGSTSTAACLLLTMRFGSGLISARTTCKSHSRLDLSREMKLSRLRREHEIMRSGPAQSRGAPRCARLKPPMQSEADAIGKNGLSEKHERAESDRAGFHVTETALVNRAIDLGGIVPFRLEPGSRGP